MQGGCLAETHKKRVEAPLKTLGPPEFPCQMFRTEGGREVDKDCGENSALRNSLFLTVIALLPKFKFSGSAAVDAQADPMRPRNNSLRCHDHGAIDDLRPADLDTEYCT